jgi:hypothetical protein
VDTIEELPAPETMLTYASILEKPKYDPRGVKLATGEIVEAACAALRICARIKAGKQENEF